MVMTRDAGMCWTFGPVVLAHELDQWADLRRGSHQHGPQLSHMIEALCSLIMRRKRS